MTGWSRLLSFSSWMKLLSSSLCPLRARPRQPKNCTFFAISLSTYGCLVNVSAHCVLVIACRQHSPVVSWWTSQHQSDNCCSHASKSLHKHLSSLWNLWWRRFPLVCHTVLSPTGFSICTWTVVTKYRIIHFLIVQPRPIVEPRCLERSWLSFSTKKTPWKVVLSRLVWALSFTSRRRWHASCKLLVLHYEISSCMKLCVESVCGTLSHKH